ncbi:MAG: glycosyltransferase [Lachnospiraceae bacterium]|nr:glycosyltransferase [Lachnospiraceae bacterium]
MNKIRVLVITGTMDVGGIENQLMHLLRNADKDEFQIDFTSTMEHSYYRDEIERLGGGYIQIPEMNWKKPKEYCRALYQVMKNGKYDVVHSHELFHSGIVLKLAYQAGIKKRIAHAHNWSDGDGTGKKRSPARELYNAVMRSMILKYSTEQVACSTLAGEFLYGKETLKKSSHHLVFNSVDTTKFIEQYDKQETGEFCDDGWINVLQVGRVTAVKNQLFLAKIAAELKARGDKIRILCAGNGDREYVEKVQNAIREGGLSDHMKMLGVRGDVDALMRKSQAFVLPSQYEGMPLVMIEAQASGLPCVAANTFSHEVDYEIGTVKWMELSDGAAAWADALENAVRMKRAKKEDVVQAIETKRFDSRMFAETICSLYR